MTPLHNPRYQTMLGTLLALSLVLASCGGGEADSTTTTAAGTDTTAPVGDGETTTTGDAAPEEPELELTTVRMAFQSPAVTAVTFEKWRQDLLEAGIDVESVEFEGADAVLRALIAGEVDLASMPPLPILQFMQETGEAGLKMIVASRKTTDYVMLASPEIQDVTQLEDEGVTVGISTPGDISDTFTRYVLGKMGVNVDNVTFLQIGGTSARVSGILAGQISAGAAHSTAGFLAEDEGDAHILVRYGDFMDNYLQPGIVTTDDFIMNNPVFTQLLVDAYIDSVRWAVDNPDDFVDLAVEWLGEGVSEDLVNRSLDLFDEIGVWAPNGGLDDEVIESTLDIERELGYLNEPIPSNDEWIDRSFVEDYLARNGTR